MAGAAAAARCSPAGEARVAGVPMKWVSLVALTVQTSAQVYVIKWGRASSQAYLPSTVVLFTELVKAAISFCLVASQAGGLLAAFSVVRLQMARAPAETMKVCVPCLLYTVQNNLMFFSLAKLSAPVQQVTYQLKIFTSALLSVTMLGTVLGPTRWLSLAILILGVSLVQWPRDLSAAGHVATQRDTLLGLVAVVAACFTSGFAGVYLEKLLKQTAATIWERNVQLGVLGALMALVAAMWQDGARILEAGFTQGYSWRVVCIIMNNALGGLLCAAVLKYADTILRCFSTAMSIIITCMLSAWSLREYEPDFCFVSGALLAIAATFLYALGPQFADLTGRAGYRRRLEAVLAPAAFESLRRLAGAPTKEACHRR